MNLDRASTPGARPERVFGTGNCSARNHAVAIGFESTLPIVLDSVHAAETGRPTTANPVPRSSGSSRSAARTSKKSSNPNLAPDARIRGPAPH